MGRDVITRGRRLRSNNSVQIEKDPRRTVQFSDRATVQAQVFRADLKAYLEQGQAFFVGDRWHARAVVIPLPIYYQGGVCPGESAIEICRKKLEELLKLL